MIFEEKEIGGDPAKRSNRAPSPPSDSASLLTYTAPLA